MGSGPARGWFGWRRVISLILVLLFAWVAVKWLQYRRGQEAAAEIEAMGGTVQYWPRFRGHSFPGWLSELASKESLKPFSDVSVILWDYNGNLAKLDFDRLRADIKTLGPGSLSLAGRRVDDSWLVRLDGLDNIERLTIEGTSISDKGLKYLAGWDRTESLCLCGNVRLTSAALANLRGMPSLKHSTSRKTRLRAEESRNFMNVRRRPD